MSPDARRALLVGLIVGALAGLWLGTQADGLGGIGEIVGVDGAANDETLDVIEDQSSAVTSR